MQTRTDTHNSYSSCPPACMACRGCNGLQLTSPRGYTATMTRDVHIAVESIKA